MKKLIFSFLLVFLVKILVFGQIGKGVYTFEPSFELATNSFANFSAFKFTPQFGTFLTPKLLVEGRIYDYIGRLGSQKTTSLAFYANASYYYYDMKKWKPYINVGLGMEQTKTSAGILAYTVNSPSIKLGTGIQYFINKNVAIDSKLGYSIQKSTTTSLPNNKVTYSVIALNIALKPFFNIASFEENEKTTDFLRKGKIIPSLNLALSNTNITIKSKGKPTKSTTYNDSDLNITADYFVVKNFMLGGGFNYVGNGYSREYGFRLSTAYFFHLKKRNYLSLGLSYVTYRNNYIATVLQGNETNYTAIANYYYFLNQNLAAIVGLNYQSELSKFSQKDYDKFYTGLKYFIH